MLTWPATAWALIDWRAPADCPTTEVVNARINALAGAAKPRVTFTAIAKVSLERAAEQPWKVFIETTLGEVKGERSFAAASCEAVTNATVVFITLMLAEHSQPPEPAPAPVPIRPSPAAKIAMPDAEPEPVAKVEPSPKAAPVQVRPVAVLPNRRLWHLRTKVGFAHNEVARTALRIAIATGVSWERVPSFAVELGVSGVFPRTTHPYANQPWIGISHQALDTHLGPCLQRAVGRVLLRGCSTLGVQMVRLISDGVAQPTSGTAFIPTAGGTLTVGWRLNATWRLVVNTSVDRRLARPSFAVQPWGTAWAAPATIFDAGVGFEWRR